MIGFNLMRSLLNMDVPYIITITTGLLGLVALGIHSYEQNRLKNYLLRISVFLLALAVVAAIQYFVLS
jgi:hypothetical protein